MQLLLLWDARSASIDATLYVFDQQLGLINALDIMMLEPCSINYDAGFARESPNYSRAALSMIFYLEIKIDDSRDDCFVIFCSLRMLWVR